MICKIRTGISRRALPSERADRIVLDSNIGDTHLDRDGLRCCALGMEQTLPDCTQWAACRQHREQQGGGAPAATVQTAPPGARAGGEKRCSGGCASWEWLADSRRAAVSGAAQRFRVRTPGRYGSAS
ncbi:hypothetical protein [Streptomyces alfalfae]